MRTPRTALRALLVLTVAAGCGGELASEQADDGLSAIAQKVVGGTVDSEHAPVVMVYNYAAGAMCSGTLISNRVMLAAAHCITSTDPADYEVVGGTDIPSDGPDWTEAVVEVARHPDYASLPSTNEHDVSVVVMAADSPVGSYRWLGDATTGHYAVGTPFTLVGFGMTAAGAGDTGVRHQVALEIDEIQTELILFGGPDANGCGGDSGAPMLVDIGGQLTVIGVVSFGDANCSVYGAGMRTDYNRAFIEQYALPDEGGTTTPTPTPGPGGDDDDDNAGDGPGGNPIGCSVSAASPAFGLFPMAAFALFALAIASRRR